jgi:hypothetical protein
LIKIVIVDSDLSAGPEVPDSLGLCTKLVTIRLQKKIVTHGLSCGATNTLSLSVCLSMINYIGWLSLQGNLFSGIIPDWIGSLNLLHHLYLGINELSGEFPIELCHLESLEVLSMYDNHIEGIPSLLTQRLYTRMHRESLSIVRA